MENKATVDATDAARAALAVLWGSAGRHDFGPLSTEQRVAVHAMARRLMTDTRDALHQLGDVQPITGSVPLTAGFDEDVMAGHGRGLFGPRAGHGMRHEVPPSWIKLDEPHLTKALARLLSPAEHGRAAVARARSFVTALHDAAGKPLPPAVADIADDLSSEAEFVLPRRQNRRIDVLLRWQDRIGQRHALVVEAKFGAGVRAGTLKAYGDYAVRSSGGRGRAHLFLVVNRLNPDDTDGTAWSQVPWLSVLRHWERLLAASPAADADDFASFRAALWARATDCR